jgi:hypothetical protein
VLNSTAWPHSKLPKHGIESPVKLTVQPKPPHPGHLG